MYVCIYIQFAEILKLRFLIHYDVNNNMFQIRDERAEKKKFTAQRDPRRMRR